MPKVVPEYKEAARKRIVEHATRLFSHKGYHRTKMIDIAKSVGVSKGALYQYFNSKTDLLLAVFEANAQMREQEVSKFLNAEGFRSVATEEFFDRMAEMRMTGTIITPSLARELSENMAVTEWIQSGSDRWVRSLAEVIEKIMEENSHSIDISSESFARGIIALRDGLYNSLLYGSDIVKVRKAWVEIMSLLIRQIVQ
ncbi:MAG: TetR/AcrR family transcriptional regulator [Candidatus Thorarchaeota archaeon]